MPTNIPDGFAQVCFNFICDGDPEPMICTLGVGDLDIAGDDDDLPDFMFAMWRDQLLGAQSVHCWLSEVVCYIGHGGAVHTVHESTLAMENGGAAGEMLPPNCAFLIRKRTSVMGRRGRGRMYLPGVPEGLVDGAGNLTGGTQAALQDSADAFFAALTAGDPPIPGVTPVVLHRSEGAGFEPVPTPLTAFQVEPKIATQRRRLRP